MADYNEPVWMDGKHFFSFNRLFECDINRIRSRDDTGFFIISAFLDDNTMEENVNRHESLKNDLREEGFRFYEIEGDYSYENGDVQRNLFLSVPLRGISPVKARIKTIRLVCTYDQNCALIRLPGKKASAFYLVYSSGREKVIGNALEYEKAVITYGMLRIDSRTNPHFSLLGVRVPEDMYSAVFLKEEGLLF